MARGTAERVIDRVFDEFGYPEVGGAINPLIGGGVENIETYLAEAVADRSAGVSEGTIRNLVYSYGTEYKQILPDANATEDSVLRGRVAYAIEREMALTLPDIVFRRTGLGTAGHPGSVTLEIAADEAAGHLGWNPAATLDQLSALKGESAWA